MHPVLRLYEDVLSSAENVAFRLPPLPRFIFVVHGSAIIAGKTLNEGEAWQGEAAVTVKPGAGGVTCWRWGGARGGPRRATGQPPRMVHPPEPDPIFSALSQRGKVVCGE